MLIFLQSDTYDLRQAATSQDDHPDAPEPAAGAVRQFARQRQHESSDDSVTEVPKQEQRLHAHRSAEITKEAGDDRRMTTAPAPAPAPATPTTRTLNLLKDIASRSVQKSKIAKALQDWVDEKGFDEEITYSKRHDVIDLKLEIEIQDVDYTCHIMGAAKDMMLGIALFPQNSEIPEDKLSIVQKWVLWRNPKLRTGSFAVPDDGLLLRYFNCVNFVGVRGIQTVMIDNMFNDALFAYEEYGAEYFDLIQT